MRYFLSVSYFGTAFHGSQIQGDIPTVQLALNQAISTLLRHSVETYGASRTDEGVHALENFYHFDFHETLPDNFQYRINAILPKEIALNAVLQPKSDENANARFDAHSRQYRYCIHRRKNPFLENKSYFFPFKIKPEILKETADILLNETDFTSFSKRNTQSYTMICHIEHAEWHFDEDGFYFTVRANRFLRGMVRALVGTQLQAGRGKISVEDFKNIFVQKDCRLADFSVPGHGLYLEKINYPEGYFISAYQP